MSKYRKTTQPLLPRMYEPAPPGEYDMYPAFSLRAGSIEHGFLPLASHLIGHSRIVIDGYFGVLWDRFAPSLIRSLSVPVLRGTLGNRAALLGAAALY